ncbi:MAG: histidine phosphatase family protein [Candidatus Odyssella sp.]|nr:histidine phosphatase family protein [Candidatus Odyssella sp.]
MSDSGFGATQPTSPAPARVTRWWWVRHAPVTADNGCIYGQVDIACDVSDEAGFAVLARRLPRGALWVTSHLQRTKQTAAAIAAAGLACDPPAEERDFAEQHFGEWQGRNRAEIFRLHGADHGMWLAPAEFCPPGGESFAALMDRVGRGIARWTAAHPGRDIVAVAHGGTIRAALGHALGLPPARALAFETANCALTRLDHVEGGGKPPAWRIVAVNHLPVA